MRRAPRAMGEPASPDALLATLLLAPALAGCLAPVPPGPEEIVAEVIDGDTLRLARGPVVRLLGINAPEKGERLGAAATAALERVVSGEAVRLERDGDDTDRHGRLLRYATVDGRDVGASLVEDGHAHVHLAAGLRLESGLREAEGNARDARRGIWIASPHAGCVALAGLQAEGENESVSLRNVCTSSRDLSGWLLKDEANHGYRFTHLGVDAGQDVTILTGCGEDAPRAVHWCSPSPVWNNDGDRLFLHDADGFLALWHAYGAPT